MKVQAQLRRIRQLATETSRNYGGYARLRRAVNAIERDRDYKVYNTDGLSVLTSNQSKRVESRVTHQGRMNTIRRAASGQSVG